MRRSRMDEDWDLPVPAGSLDIGGEVAAGLGAQGLSQAAPATHLKLDLLENGIDFIRSGIENHFSEDDSAPSARKYAVLHLFSGVLLILKERLRREHPSLIFEKVEDAGDDDRPTVSLSTALARLKSCAQIVIAQKDATVLEKVRRVRNRLEHYRVELNLNQAQSIAGQLCEFVYFFLKDHLGEDLERHLSTNVAARVQSLRKIAAHLEQQRVRRWKTRARGYKKMKVGELRALLAATEYHPRDNPIPQQAYWCPVCGKETIVAVGGQMAVCTNTKCRAVMEADGCMRCGDLVLGTTDAWFCETCQAWADAQ